jgi:signal transduction histidine kinase
MNILIVDDIKEGRYMLESLLKGSGYKVVCAENGVEALDMLKKNYIDVIISDILMPKMDGFAFCRECKRDDSLRKIPFIFYTATYTDKKDEDFALSLGAEKFMVKPTEPDKLLEILQDVIKGHREKTLVTAKKPVEEEVYLAQYNKRLVEKLEHKALDLEKELAIRKTLASELSYAEERERRRIAIGVHDNLGQKLVMVKFRLQALTASVSDRNMQTALSNEIIMMDDILDDIRSLTFELSNPLLYEVGFESAIKSWLKTEIQKNAGLKCEFTSDDKKIELDEDIKIVLFKAARELLINIVKHAKARTVKVGIAKRNNEVVVTVEDDGAGFDVSKLGLPSGEEGGFGLFSVKERLEYMGGRLEIESWSGKGTRIVMTAPVTKSEQGQERGNLHEGAHSR